MKKSLLMIIPLLCMSLAGCTGATISSYTFNFLFNIEGEQTTLEEGAKAYIIGSWDNWEEFLPLEENDGVYSYTFTNIDYGEYEYKGLMWWDDLEVSWTDCVEIITDNGNNATLTIEKKTTSQDISVELSSQLPERFFDSNPIDLEETLNTLIEHGYYNGATSFWTDCQFLCDGSVYRLCDEEVDNMSYVFSVDDRAKIVDDILYTSGYDRTIFVNGIDEQDYYYYDGSEGIEYQYHDLINEPASFEDKFVRYYEEEYSLEDNYLIFFKNVDDFASDWLTQLPDILETEGYSINATYSVSQFGNIKIDVIYRKEYEDFETEEVSMVSYADFNESTEILVIYDKDYNFISFDYYYEKITETQYTRSYGLTHGYRDEINYSNETLCLSHYDGEIKRPDWAYPAD